MKCPNCEETLVMSDRQGVEIDYCPKCRGVWLDRGELDKIIERNGEIQYGGGKYAEGGFQGSKEQDDDYYKQHRQQPHKKKRGFLGDMFDFD